MRDFCGRHSERRFFNVLRLCALQFAPLCGLVLLHKRSLLIRLASVLLPLGSYVLVHRSMFCEIFIKVEILEIMELFVGPSGNQWLAFLFA